MEDDESAEEAIVRELREELSLKDIKSCKLVQENIQDNRVKQYIFHIKIDANLKDLKLREGKDMKYIARKELFEREFAFNIKKVLERFIKEQLYK
jgi:ADP-ribose pyrophosphatase YjhB (NUDIX family)